MTWSVRMSEDWDVLGPFPIHAREQHFLSPLFPLDLSEPISHEVLWFSSYPDNARVAWSKAKSSEGRLSVTFPHVRWDNLRSTEGWASFQHHSVLRTTFTVYPPLDPVSMQQFPKRVLVDLVQGSYFTIVPAICNDTTSWDGIPKWYSGNIYALTSSTPQAVTLPVPPSVTEPTSYHLFVSGDYEIRLFGVPGSSGIPELQTSLYVQLDDAAEEIEHLESHDVIPHIIDGWLFGRAMGIGVHSRTGWWKIESLVIDESLKETLQVELLQEFRIAPSQARIVPVKLTQLQPLSVSEIRFQLTVTHGDMTRTLFIDIPLTHKPKWDESSAPFIRATYFYSTSMPTAFMAIPPLRPNARCPSPPVLALHGAGVDIFSMDFWLRALPRQDSSWTIVPSGRTEWGLDWHGPSNQDTWATVDALHDILQSRESWAPWGLQKNGRVAVVGHSNGGQGAWYTAARFPDRIVVAIPAAGYIKSQAYVPLTQSRSGHFIDPSMRAILESSLTPDDNDLFLTNLVDTPVLAIHGGDDDNVPVWHTREAVSVIKTWKKDANIIFREDQGQPHWYPTVFDNDFVQQFLRTYIEPARELRQERHEKASFTLTVAIPSDSGPLHGWRIHTLQVPGRLARLAVRIDKQVAYVKTTNVKVFAIESSCPFKLSTMVIDGHQIELSDLQPPNGVTFAFDTNAWNTITPSAIPIQPTGRLLNILSSPSRLTLIIPGLVGSSSLSAALRIAHDLDLYHKLDSQILEAEEALDLLVDGNLDPGNLVILGSGHDEFSRHLLQQNRTPFQLKDGRLTLRGKCIDDSAATLFLHPHPSSPTSLALFVHYNDNRAMERALRLFPIRTGVTVPDWIIVGESADTIAAAGVIGAGVWGNDWSWNEGMSSF